MKPVPERGLRVLRPPDPDGGVWSREPTAGSLCPARSVHNLCTLRVTVEHRIEDVEQTVSMITGRLSLCHLTVDADGRGRTEFTITVATPDLWQALLLTMNAVASTGHTAVALTAETAAEYESHASARSPAPSNHRQLGGVELVP